MTNTVSAAGAGTAGSAPADAQLRRSAVDFTATMLAQLLAPMFATAASDGAFDGGPGEQAFRPMLVAEFAKAMARGGGLGLTEPVYRQLLILQDGAHTGGHSP